MIYSFKSIDYYYTTDVSISSNNQSPGFGVINNLNICIDKDLIKDIFFTDIINNDNSKVKWSREESICVDNNRNSIIFEPCDKLQTADTFIKMVFINGYELITTNSRKVSII